MRLLHGFANLFILFLTIMQMNFTFNEIRNMEHDLNTARLQAAIDNSTKYAFMEALKSADISTSYDAMDAFIVDPTDVLDNFSVMMLKCYDLSETPGNIHMIKQHIDGAVLCDNDGYYMLTVQDVPYDDAYDGTVLSSDLTKYTLEKWDSSVDGREELASSDEYDVTLDSKQLMWSIKMPYYVKVEKNGETHHVALEMSTGDTVVIIDGQEQAAFRSEGTTDSDTFQVNIEHDGLKYSVLHTIYDSNYMGPHSIAYTEEEINDAMKFREINLTVARHLNASIDEIAKARGRERDYTVWFPTETTRKGINPIRNSCLLVAMSDVPFVPGVDIVEPSLAGYTAVTKQFVVGYKAPDGAYEYCYMSQHPDAAFANPDGTGIGEETFLTMTEAASAGYQPSLEYLIRPIMRFSTKVEGLEYVEYVPPSS